MALITISGRWWIFQSAAVVAVSPGVKTSGYPQFQITTPVIFSDLRVINVYLFSHTNNSLVIVSPKDLKLLKKLLKKEILLILATSYPYDQNGWRGEGVKGDWS